ncbi:MAG TPA: glycosyltransferase 87 family protein [Gaiellaceae bacterium]
MSRPAPLPASSDDRLAAALAAGAVFLVAWGLVHHWFWAHGQIVDWPTYRDYGNAIRHGRVPYRDFGVDYPPGSLPVFALPSFVGTGYAETFAWVMAVCGVALVAVVAWLRPAAALYVGLAPVLVGSLILSRFDLWPALLATAALACLLSGRDGLGWALLGAAVAAKLWPLVLVPPALVWSLRRGRSRAPLAGAVVVALAVVPFALLAPHGFWHSIEQQASRPLQIESLGASFVTTFGHPHVATSHGSQNLTGHDTVAALSVLAQVVALLSLWLAFARGAATPERLVRYSAACTCAFVAFGKVLSPQYLIWLVPLVPLVRGRRGLAATGLLTAALVLTQVWFPRRYWSYVDAFRLAPVVLARDLVLVALVAVLAWPVSGNVDLHSDA